ncbi:unnamed protein product [Closterium sp. Naga37s-1]|nr:unnamed protein product [Closterium sp. Naga37s-1]
MLDSTRVLLDENGTAKLSGYGEHLVIPEEASQKILINSIKMSGYSGNSFIVRWPSECSSDVYAFGVLLLELLTGRKALDTSRGSHESLLADFFKPMLNDTQTLLTYIDPRMQDHGAAGSLGTHSTRAGALANDVEETLLHHARMLARERSKRAEDSARREEAEARWRAAEQEADGLRRELAALLSRRAGDPGVSATGVGQERLGEAGAGMAGKLAELEREMAELRRDVGEVTRWVRRSEMRAREGWRAVEGMMGGMRRRMDRTRGEEGAPGGGGGVSSVGAEERAGERAGEESGDEAGRRNCEMREGLGDAWSMLGVWGGEVVAGRGSGNEGGGAWASELGEGETGCVGAAEGRWREIGRGKERWGGRWERVIRRIGDVGARVQGERWQQVELEQQVERAGREVARVKALLGRAMGAEGKIDDEVGEAGQGYVGSEEREQGDGLAGLRVVGVGEVAKEESAVARGGMEGEVEGTEGEEGSEGRRVGKDGGDIGKTARVEG